jgi:hypothetical protein
MTKTLRIFAALGAVVLASLIACSKHNDPTLSRGQKDPALQTALDELTRLGSYTKTGLNYTEYFDRLLTAKGNIDVALQHTSDKAAKSRIEVALIYYIGARDSWKDSIDHDHGSTSFIYENYVQEQWRKASDATEKAAGYAFADDAARREIDKREEEELYAETRSAAEAEKTEKEGKANDAEQDKVRRFSPEGTAYNLQRITVPTPGGVAAIPPGTELKVTKNPNGTLHIQEGDLAADVPSSAVTNDRDLAAALRSNDKNEQDAFQQRRSQQAAIAAEQEKQKYLQPTPTPDY